MVKSAHLEQFQTITEPQTDFHNMVFFLHHFSSGIGLFDRSDRLLLHHTVNFAKVLGCTKKLVPTFPLCVAPNDEGQLFSEFFDLQLSRLDYVDNITFYWNFLARGQERIFLKIEIWNLPAPEDQLCGIKVSNITMQKKEMKSIREMIRIV